MAIETVEMEYASWEDWRPEDYLSEYYLEVMPDEQYALEFLVEALARVPEAPVALEFGCGPTIHHAFPLVRVAQEIHLAEYLPSNRTAVQRWLEGRAGAHDWSAFSRETLRLEGDLYPADSLVEQLEQQLRKRVTCVLPGDAADPDPLGRDRRGFYRLVTSHFCAESATADRATWRRYMRNIASLVHPGGVLIVSACGDASFYRVGDRRFPCAGIGAGDLLDSLSENGFGDIDLRVRLVEDHAEQGYGSVIFASAVKNGSAA